MKILKTLTLFLFYLPLISYGQYTESFNIADKGADPVTPFTTNLIGVNWSMELGTYVGVVSATPQYAKTVAGALEYRNTDKEVCFISPLLGINTPPGPRSIAIDFQAVVIDVEDWIQVGYQVNNGAWVELGNQFGGGIYTVSVPGAGQDANLSGTITASGISGDTLKIRICATSSNTLEFLRIFELRVPETGTVVLVSNNSPVANDDSGPVLIEDGPNGTVNVINNDTDPDGNPAAPVNGVGQFSVDLDPVTSGIQTSFTNSAGSWTLATATGIVTFDPANNYNGTAVISYRLCDPAAACDNANISFVVTPVNDPPIANDDAGPGLVQNGANGTVNVLTNDTDADGNPGAPVNGVGQFTVDLDPATIGIQTSFTDATGVWTLATATGIVTFDPANNYNGTAVITYTLCDPSGSCDNATITFVVSPPPVILNCPVNTITSACQTQTAVDAAFATWLATASASGGCNGVLSNNNTGAPPACGGNTTVIFTYTSTCAPLTTTCQATFTVASSPPVVLSCPTNTTIAACQSQAAVNTAFAAWLATTTASGGCNGALTNNNTGAPPACGGSTTVTFTYTSSCAPFTTTCQATFTVASSPPVVLICPTNTTNAACQSQTAVNIAFAAWLATANASGGCNGALTNNNTGAPPACGGSTTVTFTYTSSCAPFTTTCQATFTVAAAPTVVLSCPINTTSAACLSQAAVNTAFTTWLATANASGGCNGVLTNNNTGAPPACGGSTTVTFTYTSSCAPFITTCQATFTVPAAPVVGITCPVNTNVVGLSQMDVNAAFATWLMTASASGGCNGMLTNNNVGAPLASGGSTTVTFTYTSSCAPTTTTCQATFSVQAGFILNMETNTYYVTLQDAIDAAVNGQTILLLQDVSEANINVSHSVTIKANGFQLTIPSGNLNIPLNSTLIWPEGNLMVQAGAFILNQGILINNAVITHAEEFNNNGLYKGKGIFNGTMVNHGKISPGN